MTSAVNTQVGGTHYKSMAIQPLELGYANQYDAPIYSAIKYVSRHRAKDGKQGLEKAKHCVQFAVEMREKWGAALCKNLIPMEDYIEANGFDMFEAAILLDLHQFALVSWSLPKVSADLIVQKIDALIEMAYGASANV